MRRFWSFIAGAVLASQAMADMAGPPRPVPPKRSLVEQTGDLYRERYGLEARNVTCAPARAGEVVVCGGRSLYRVPLPDERGPRDHARLPTGEIPRAAGGDSPVPGPRSAGRPLTIPLEQLASLVGLGRLAK